MGCGCGGSKAAKAKPVRFKVTWKDGTSKTYMSKIEADAAVASKPGGSISTTR